jgi:hypothetical protein
MSHENMNIGSRMMENEAMAWIEDQVIPSFRFKKMVGGNGG